MPVPSYGADVRSWTRQKRYPIYHSHTSKRTPGTRRTLDGWGCYHRDSIPRYIDGHLNIENTHSMKHLTANTVKTLLACVLFAMTGCTQQVTIGKEKYSSGNMGAAYQDFTQCASLGDTECMNMLGIMFTLGQVNGKQDIQQAVDWFKTSARLGNKFAANNLKQLGYPSPDADLEQTGTPFSEQLAKAILIGGIAMVGAEMIAEAQAKKSYRYRVKGSSSHTPSTKSRNGYMTKNAYGAIVNSNSSYVTRNSSGALVNSRASYFTKDISGAIVNSTSCYFTNNAFGAIVNTCN